MHAYIRLLDESLRDFRALMTSARARLIDVSASEALSHSRIWARRSDLSPHHSHTLASCGKIPVLHSLFTPCISGGFLRFCHPLDLLSTHQRPRAPGVLVGQGHSGLVPPTTLHQRLDPLAPAVTLPAYPAQTAPGPVHQQFAERASALCADAQQARCAARAVLSWNQPEPGGKPAAIVALGRITHRCHQGGGRECPKAWDRHRPLTDWVRLRHLGQRRIVGRHTTCQRGQLLQQLPEQCQAVWRQRGGFRGQLLQHMLKKGRRPLRHDNALCVQQPPRLIDQRRPCLHQPLPHAVQRLEILLRHRLHGHKAHGRARHGCGDRFGLPQIVFVRLPLRRHKRRCHEADLVPVLPKAACPIRSATTGFHTKECRGQLGNKRHHLRAIKPFAQQHRALLMHPHEGKHLLCDVDAEDVKLLFHWTRLLPVNDVVRPLKSFWLIEAVPHRGGSISLI